MDAEKIKKKLNGSILKGTKVKIDKARPQKEVMVEQAGEEEPERPKKEKKKRKRDELPGVDIGDRHVKRGWTTPGKDIPKDKVKTMAKSKFTTGLECLFKTNLPPNVASKTKTTEAKPDTKRKRKPGKEAVVHEFTKTTKYATFLRSSSGSSKTKTVAEFVEDKGWVDEDGNIVEAITKSRRPKPKARFEAPAPVPVEEVDNESSSETPEVDIDPALPSVQSEDNNVFGEVPDSESLPTAEEAVPSVLEETVAEAESSSDESSEDESKNVEVEPPAEASKGDSSSSSDESDSEREASSSSDDESKAEEHQHKTMSRPQSSAGPALTIKIPELTMSTPIVSSVHPLEALYKRPKKGDLDTPKPEAASFSFFGGDNEDDEDIEVETQLQVPLTPFTQKDFEFRGMRSAAPTPDTAHPNKRFIWPSKDGEDEDEDDEHEASSPIRKSELAKGKDEKSSEQESDFQKWFWENRGNVNRAWKKRKRTVAKEKRQRESRKRNAV